MSTFSGVRKGFSEGLDVEIRPDFVTNEHLEFLDDLRESGAVNMFGARSYVADEFPELTSGQAATILSYWMKTFGKETR